MPPNGSMVCPQQYCFSCVFIVKFFLSPQLCPGVCLSGNRRYCNFIIVQTLQFVNNVDSCYINVHFQEQNSKNPSRWHRTNTRYGGGPSSQTSSPSQKNQPAPKLIILTALLAEPPIHSQPYRTTNHSQRISYSDTLSSSSSLSSSLSS